MKPIELLRYRQSELAALFVKLPAPDRLAIDGVWRGRLMAFSGLGWLPRWLCGALYRLLALPINPWRGKGFNKGEGLNRWFGFPGIGFGAYKLSAITSPVDGQPALLLDYARQDNPALFRHIRGEGRLLGDGSLLGRVFWQGKSQLYLIAYFTLTRASQ